MSASWKKKEEYNYPRVEYTGPYDYFLHKKKRLYEGMMTDEAMKDPRK
jgi:hypothetical protein